MRNENPQSTDKVVALVRGGKIGPPRQLGPVPKGQTIPQISVPPPLMPHGQGQPRPRVLGPCYYCGGFGHLAATTAINAYCYGSVKLRIYHRDNEYTYLLRWSS